MTALHWCVLRGHEICARLLLDRGAEVDVMQKVPIFCCSQRLLACGNIVGISSQGHNTTLLLACAGGHENIARLLIERGAELHEQNHRYSANLWLRLGPGN